MQNIYRLCKTSQGNLRGITKIVRKNPKLFLIGVFWAVGADSTLQCGIGWQVWAFRHA
jgi:hypothetical protein